MMHPAEMAAVQTARIAESESAELEKKKRRKKVGRRRRTRVTCPECGHEFLA